VALGGHALKALTPRQGILIWRGSPLPLKGRLEEGPKVMPTLHPAYLMRSAGLFSVAVKDLQRGLALPPERYNLWPTLEDVRKFTSPVFSFDLEWDENLHPTICGLSDRFYNAIVVPWTWEFLPELKRIFEGAKKIIGHNIISADLKFLPSDWHITAELHDTMLKQHLIQPDYRHNLGFVASVFTRKVFWKGTGEETEDDDGSFLATGAQWKTWNSPEAIPVRFGGYGGCQSPQEAFRLYNARDTDGEFQIDFPISNTLKTFGMEDVYWNVSVPVAFICREMSEQGVRIDPGKVGEIRTSLNTEIAKLEQTLPEGLKPYEQPITRNAPAPAGTYKQKIKKCKGNKKAGTKHDPVDITFDRPGTRRCPVCGAECESGPMVELKIVKVPDTKTITPWNSTPQVLAYAKSIGCKTVTNVKTGNVTADKNARKVWGREHTEFTIVDQLKKSVTLRNGFVRAEMLEVDRVYFNLLVHGTAEGRLSSSGRRPGIDPNIQNQPTVIRPIYIPDSPGFGILDIDISQGENMLTAWLAKDYERLERLRTPGYDEHAALATMCFGKPVTKSNENSYLRKPAKVINHGKNYGMGWEHMQTNLALEGFFYSAKDVKEMNEIWAKLNPGTARWQKETVELAKQQGYLVNPFGRKRFFQTRDYATKALAFLPASTLADVVLRMMIAHFPAGVDELSKPIFQRAIHKLGLAVIGELVPGWRMMIQVHDSLVFCGPHETHMEQARRSKAIMTQSWKELNGFSLGVEAKYSTVSWGDVKTIEIL
jgi:DNA polymerase I-like protein with 3'-5' exonuclease and polymerase domains